MVRKAFVSGSAQLAVASFVAASLVAAPVAFSSGYGLTANAARAFAGDFAPGMGDNEKSSGRVYSAPLETLGVTTGPSGNGRHTQAAGIMLRDYKRDLVQGELTAAAQKLAALSKRPITQELVTELNTQLGVQTSLADVQIAHAAAAMQKKTS